MNLTLDTRAKIAAVLIVVGIVAWGVFGGWWWLALVALDAVVLTATWLQLRRSRTV